MPGPEEKARTAIDDLLQQAGWAVQNTAQVNLSAGCGVAIREFPLKAGYGFADYLLYINGAAAGVIEAKKAGTTLTGVETQALRYSEGLPERLPAHIRPLPFCYQSTGTETRFTCGLDPEPRSRQVFSFHRPETLATWISRGDRPVADHVNVDFDVYRIRTQITEQGAKVEAGLFIDRRDRETRRVRWEKLDEELSYDASQLDRQVVAPDQIRTVIRTFKEKLFTDIFPGRKDVPKTLIYAKDDSHADDIVQIVREEFGKGNDFAQKITYRTNTARIVTKKTGSDGQEMEEIT